MHNMEDNNLFLKFHSYHNIILNMTINSYHHLQQEQVTFIQCFIKEPVVSVEEVAKKNKWTELSTEWTKGRELLEERKPQPIYFHGSSDLKEGVQVDFAEEVW